MSARRAGFSLMEAMISVGLFGLLALVLFWGLRAGTRAWLQVDSRSDAEVGLRRVEQELLKDVERASTAQIGIRRVGAGDGYAIWFLSPIYYAADNSAHLARDGDTGQIYCVDNILYYAVRPSNHGSCSLEPADDGAANPPGGDRFCPHKALIRKAIYHVDSDGEASLLTPAQVAAWCTRPQGHDLGPMAAEPSLDPTQPPRELDDNLLTFFPRLVNQELILDLAGCRVREAERNFGVGSRRLDDSPYAVPHRIKSFPPNS